MKKITLVFICAFILGCEQQEKRTLYNPNGAPIEIDSSMEIDEKHYDDGIMSAQEVKLLLIGSGYKKALVAFGEPDDMGNSADVKLDCVVYYNKARDVDGVVKNVVLIRIWGQSYNSNSITIDNVLIVPEGGSFLCGNTPWKIVNGKLK